MPAPKKIKLITFAPHPNFGTCLQSYALSSVLRSMGHDVEFIYNSREVPPQPLLKRVVKGCAALLLPRPLLARVRARFGGNGAVVPAGAPPVVLELPNEPVRRWWLGTAPGRWLQRAWACRSRQRRKVYHFAHTDGNFRLRRLFTPRDYEAVRAEADVFVTGSDQIWNPYCGGYNPLMFVEPGGDVKRVAYASSISLRELPPSVAPRMRSAWQKFSHIGVREAHSVELLRAEVTGVDVQQVADPTCLLSAAEWTAFGERAHLEFTPPERFIFCYFVGDARRDFYEQMVGEAQRFTGIRDVITLECTGRLHNYGDGRLYADGGPYEWVELLRRASYVCMDSFHATLFALKFGKDFVHALKYDDSATGSQNTRIHDVLGRLGLSYKIYTGSGDAWQQPVDYAAVRPLLEAEAERSRSYLEQALAD